MKSYKLKQFILFLKIYKNNFIYTIFVCGIYLSGFVISSLSRSFLNHTANVVKYEVTEIMS